MYEYYVNIIMLIILCISYRYTSNYLWDKIVLGRTFNKLGLNKIGNKLNINRFHIHKGSYGSILNQMKIMNNKEHLKDHILDKIQYDQGRSTEISNRIREYNESFNPVNIRSRYSNMINDIGQQGRNVIESRIDEMKQQGRSRLDEMKQQGRSRLDEIKQQGRYSLDEMKQRGRSRLNEMRQSVGGNPISNIEDALMPKNPFYLFAYWIVMFGIMYVGSLFGVLIVNSVKTLMDDNSNASSSLERIKDNVSSYISQNNGTIIFKISIFCCVHFVFDLLKYDAYIVPAAGEIIEIIERIPIIWSIVWSVLVMSIFYSILSSANSIPECNDNKYMERCFPAFRTMKCPEEESSWKDLCWFRI